MADRERRGFWSSFQYVTIIGGQLCALALLVVLQVAARRGGDAGLGLADRLRRRRRAGDRRLLHPPPADETLSFENVARKATGAQSTVGNLFRDHPREAFLVMALTAGGTLAFYAYTIYLQKFLANTSGFDRATASRIMTVALALHAADPAARRADCPTGSAASR